MFFSHVVRSQLSFITYASLSALDHTAAGQAEVRGRDHYTTEHFQKLHAVNKITLFGQQLPHETPGALSEHCGGSSEGAPHAQ